jgi:hypothetical protein
MIGDRTYRLSRWSQGTLHLKQFWNMSFGYTATQKKVAAGATTAVLAATATVVVGRTLNSGNATITNPDVPRALTITAAGTAADIAAGDVVITGTNVQGKTIVENFTMANDLAGTVTGIQAFKTVTSIVFPAADGTGATISVGTSNKLGVNHPLFPGKTSVVVLSQSAVDATPLQQAVPTVVTDGEQVEYNLITPATTPNGSTFLTIAYWYHNITLDTIDDDPEYATSTSTSSSTSTSVSTSTSKSTSTSSTSISTSSTSVSTSSTSTSTTTAP